jgi:uncharacterized membrane protein
MLVLDVAFRFIHIFTAIVLLGGAVYLRFVLMPAAAELPEAEHDALRARTRAKWKRIVMVGILLLLVTGFYNYLQVQAPAHQGQSKYHMLMGIKILLAFAVFFLASVLTGRAAKFEGMRRNPSSWLLLLIVLAGSVVAIGSVLKVAMPGKGVIQPAMLPQNAQ